MPWLAAPSPYIAMATLDLSRPYGGEKHRQQDWRILEREGERGCSLQRELKGVERVWIGQLTFQLGLVLGSERLFDVEGRENVTKVGT